MGSIPLEELIKGKKITKTIFGDLKRTEEVSVLSEDRLYIVTTEKHNEEVEVFRHYKWNKGEFGMVHSNFYNPLTGKFYNEKLKL